MGVYQIFTLGVQLSDNVTLHLDLDNEPQPDVVLLIDQRLGGQARISYDDYVEGAPELVVEVAASNAANNLHYNKEAYRRNDVQEYIVWQILVNKLNEFSLQNSEYVLPDTDGIIKN